MEVSTPDRWLHPADSRIQKSQIQESQIHGGKDLTGNTTYLRKTTELKCKTGNKWQSIKLEITGQNLSALSLSPEYRHDIGCVLVFSVVCCLRRCGNMTGF